MTTYAPFPSNFCRLSTCRSLTQCISNLHLEDSSLLGERQHVSTQDYEDQTRPFTYRICHVIQKLQSHQHQTMILSSCNRHGQWIAFYLSWVKPSWVLWRTMIPQHMRQITDSEAVTTSTTRTSLALKLTSPGADLQTKTTCQALLFTYTLSDITALLSKTSCLRIVVHVLCSVVRHNISN